MSSPIMNFKLPAKPEHKLRAVAVLAFPPGFVWLTLHGVVSERVNPALGTIPMFFSAVLCGFLIHRANKAGCNCKGFSGQPIVLLADFLIAIGLLTELILTWVNLHGWSSHAIMGTYGTNFLLIDFGVHAYITLQYVYESLTSSSIYPSSCPQCHYSPFSNFNGRGRRLADGRIYDPLLGDVQDEAPQPYQDIADEPRRPSSLPPKTGHDAADIV